MKDLIDIAIKAGIEASQSIVSNYQKDVEIQIKSDQSPVTEADIQSSKILEAILGETKLPIISEENDLPDYAIRKQYETYFLIDPLDGTKEFINKTGEFCVNIALVYNNTPTLGFIFDPINEKLLFGGSHINDLNYIDFNLKTIDKKKVTNTDSQTYRIITSHRADFKKLENFVREKHQVEKTSIITKGSALKFIDLTLGKADLYPRFGNTMEWDIAPGYAILNQIQGGIKALETNGEIFFNKENLLNPPFVAYNNLKYE